MVLWIITKLNTNIRKKVGKIWISFGDWQYRWPGAEIEPFYRRSYLVSMWKWSQSYVGSIPPQTSPKGILHYRKYYIKTIYVKKFVISIYFKGRSNDRKYASSRINYSSEHRPPYRRLYQRSPPGLYTAKTIWRHVFVNDTAKNILIVFACLRTI